MSMSHGGHTGHMPASGDRKALVISGWLTGLYFIVELGIGIWTGSVAVISDAFHTFSAVGGVLIALVALRLTERKSSPARTFGYVRAEILGALFNGLFLVAMALFVLWMGAMRLVEPIELATTPMLFALGFLVFGPQLLIGVAAVGFVPKKAIGAADGIKGTFAYLIGDSFAKLGLGMIADGTPVFGLTGWAGTFAALDAAAIGCICLMAIVAIFEERKIRREKKNRVLQTA